MIKHDDLLYPEFLAGIGDLADQHPDATLFQTAFDLIDSDGLLIQPCRPVPESESWIGFLAARCWGLRDSLGRKVCSAETCCTQRLHSSGAWASVSADRTISLILALRRYAEILEQEFASFRSSRKGQTAIATLIAREVSIFHSKWLYWALPDSAKEAVIA